MQIRHIYIYTHTYTYTQIHRCIRTNRISLLLLVSFFLAFSASRQRSRDAHLDGREREVVERMEWTRRDEERGGGASGGDSGPAVSDPLGLACLMGPQSRRCQQCSLLSPLPSTSLCTRTLAHMNTTLADTHGRYKSAGRRNYSAIEIPVRISGLGEKS